MPSEEVLLKLAGVLGDDILRVARWGPFGEDRAYRVDAIVALWRIRIDVLRDPIVLGASPKAQAPAARLADELEAVACRAAESKIHVRNGRLDSLRRITETLPTGARMMLAVEAMGMMLDAPLHVLRPEARKRARKSVAEMIRRDLGLETSRALTSLQQGPRDLWKWEDMTCVGGTLGQLHALCSGDESVLLLKGFDPSGWMGWGMAAGIWQVRPNTLALDGSPERDADGVAKLGGNLAGSDRYWIPPIQRVQMADAALNRLSRSEGIGLPQHPSMEWLGLVDSSLWHALLMAKALGRHWVRQQANRLYAVYQGFPESTDRRSSIRPSREGRRDRSAGEPEQAAARIYAFEAKTSGTDDHEMNAVLREWADFADTWHATISKLR